MIEVSRLLTLEQIKSQFPPKSELFSLQGNKSISAEVSRDSSGKILYVVPGSIKEVTRPQSLPPATL